MVISLADNTCVNAIGVSRILWIDKNNTNFIAKFGAKNALFQG